MYDETFTSLTNRSNLANYARRLTRRYGIVSGTPRNGRFVHQLAGIELKRLHTRRPLRLSIFFLLGCGGVGVLLLLRLRRRRIELVKPGGRYWNSTLGRGYLTQRECSYRINTLFYRTL